MAVNDFSNEMYEFMGEVSREVLKEHPTLDFSEEQATELELGLFSMSWGLFQITKSGVNVFEKVLAGDGAFQLNLHMIKRFLHSWFSSKNSIP